MSASRDCCENSNEVYSNSMTVLSARVTPTSSPSMTPMNHMKRPTIATFHKINRIDENHEVSNLMFRVSAMPRQSLARISNINLISSAERSTLVTSPASEHQLKQLNKLVILINKRLAEDCPPTTVTSFDVLECSSSHVQVRPSKPWSPQYDVLLGSASHGISRLFETLDSNKRIFNNMLDAIKQAPQETIDLLVAVLQKHDLKQLMTQPVGSQLVQKLLSRSLDLQNAVASMTDEVILTHFHNEHSSRTLQVMLELNSAFRKRLVSLLSRYWSHVVSSQASVYLACACIWTCKQSHELHWMFLNLMSSSSKFLTSKYHKKILLHYLSLCDAEMRESIATKILAGIGIIHILKDKHLSMMLVTLINSGCAPACDLLAVGLHRSLIELSQANCFNFVMVRCDFGRANAYLVQMLIDIVFSINLNEPSVSITELTTRLTLVAACTSISDQRVMSSQVLYKLSEVFNHCLRAVTKFDSNYAITSHTNLHSTEIASKSHSARSNPPSINIRY